MLRQLPRDSFPDPSVSDRVSQLPTASKEAREQILSGLKLYPLRHPLLDNARSYFDRGDLPDLHREATQARSSKGGKTLPVYEVRSHSGAAWRGGVIRDDEGDPWLAHANTHDRFHASAKDVFSDKIHYAPSKIDYLIRKNEEAAAKRDAENVECLMAMASELKKAVLIMPNRHSATITLPNSTPFEIAFEIRTDHGAKETASAHRELAEIELTMEIGTSDYELRSRLLRLYIPYLQPDPDRREAVYDQNYSKIHFILVLTQAQLAQALIESETSDEPIPATIPEPKEQHYFEQRKLAEAFILGEPLRSLCGHWIVPTKEGELIQDLPVCERCESIEPNVQSLLDIVRKLES